MPTVITPNGTNFPTGLTVPSAGDSPIRAVDLIVPVQGVFDRTENNKLRVDTIATLVTRAVLQLGNRQTLGTGGGKVIYSTADQAFWAVGGAAGGNDVLRASSDRGFWVAQTVTPAYGTGFVDLDADASGNLVITGNVASAGAVVDFTRSGNFPGGTFANRSVFAASTTGASVVHDPVRARWALLGYDGTAQRVFHSTNRSSWTSVASLLTGTQRPRAWVNKTSGRIVAANTNGASSINLMTSDDGGQTWTARAAVTTAFTLVGSQSIDMAYGAADGVWLMAVTNTATSTEIWRSTDDGTTWVLRATLAGNTVVQGSSLVAIGSIWCAVRVLGSSGIGLIYSEDQGLTWRFSGWRPNGTSIAEAWLAAGDGGLAFSGTVGGAGVLYTSSLRTGLFGTPI